LIVPARRGSKKANSFVIATRRPLANRRLQFIFQLHFLLADLIACSKSLFQRVSFAQKQFGAESRLRSYWNRNLSGGSVLAKFWFLRVPLGF